MFLIRRASSTTSLTLCRILTQYKRQIRPLSSSSSLSLSSSSSSSSSSYGLYRLLTEDERQILDEQRKLTKTSRKLTSKVGATSLDRILSSQSSSFLEELQLETTFSVIIAGEFNAGKSTLINALLGSKLLESGALPTTDSITIVASSSSSSPSTVNDDDGDKDSPSATAASTNDISTSLGVIVHSVSTLPLLDDLTLIDTPGTNSAWMDHTEQTLRLLPAADLILFVTSADRPFSDSERNLLQSIQAYHKNIVVVINKMDILDISGGDHGAVQKKDVLDFVTDKSSELLGARPVVIPISARNALSSKLTQSSSSSSSSSPSAVWDRSNFAALETFLKDTLTTKAKIKSKLSNPLGVTEGVMTQCLDVLKEQQEELEIDVATLNIFRSQFEGWKKELAADLILSQKTMTDMVREEGHRCDILLNRMNLYNYHYWTLFETNRLEEEWVDTKREVSIHRQHDEDLKADLMEHVLETA
jgi:small GTP-binding protein